MRILNRNRARPGVSWWVVLGWLALLCGVSPARGQVEPWRFVVFGDSRGSDPSIPVNTNLLAELALEVVAQRPAFLLFLGDYSYSGGEEALAVWTNTMAPVFEAGIPIYPVVGNHEVYSAHLISNLFGAALPGNGPAGDAGCTYAVAHSNALVVVLNQFVLTNQYRVNQVWLNAVLGTNRRPHVFVAGHLPAFKVAPLQGLHSFPAERDLFWNSLSNANAR